MIMWLKACPRCRGDLYVERLVDGEQITCLQCGYSPSYRLEKRVPTSGAAGKTPA